MRQRTVVGTYVQSRQKERKKKLLPICTSSLYTFPQHYNIDTILYNTSYILSIYVVRITRKVIIYMRIFFSQFTFYSDVYGNHITVPRAGLRVQYIRPRLK